MSEMFSNEENLKDLPDDVDPNQLNMVDGCPAPECDVITHGGRAWRRHRFCEEEHESLIYCKEHADEVFSDGGVEFHRRLGVQVEKRREEKKFDADMQALKEKGDKEGQLRLFQAKMRSDGLEEHCGDLLHCTLVDDELFSPPQPKPECPICMLTLPPRHYCSYQPCCGKVLCNGCLDYQKHSGVKYDCPFCRAAIASSDEERVSLTKKRAELNDREALFMLGVMYMEGAYGLPKSYKKAHELIGRAADLGLPAAHHTLANAYAEGLGVRRGDEKYWHHRRLAAIGGMVESRYLLGLSAYEAEPPNMELAVKHWVLAAEAGDDDSLEGIKSAYKKGCVTKDTFAKVLRAHKAVTDEVQSKQRDESKVFREEWSAKKKRGYGGYFCSE